LIGADKMPIESKGLLGSLSAFASTLVSVAHTRLELLSTDLEEDRERLFSLVALYLIAAFCLVVGLVIAIILIVFILWESHRLLALSLVAGFFVLAGLGICALAMHKAKTKPRLFSASLSELLKDQQELDAK
jgi:uncharacterized membrane protein YqjE